MARYTTVQENGIETSTLNFRGRDFTITMSAFDENGFSRSVEKCLDIQIEEAYPDDENLEEILDLLEGLGDTFDWEESLNGLTNFEDDGDVKNSVDVAVDEDAQLIAAAPKMYEALSHIYQLHCKGVFSLPDKDYIAITKIAEALLDAQGSEFHV